ncbi:MAG: hypothetical protein ABFS86_02790 [Planctomycetota bacterium]
MGDAESNIDREIERFQDETDSAADLPGRIRVNLFRFARAFPHRVQWWFVTLAVIGALAWFVHGTFLVAAVPVLIWMRRHWRNLRGHFLSGCLNAAKVVSLDPPLVAASTDLDVNEDSSSPCPVLRILPQPLGLMVPGDPEIGRRAATVSLYGWTIGDRDHWSTFHPFLVDVATGNAEKIRESIDRLDDEDWADLEFALAQVPQPYTPGLYRIYEPLERPLPAEPTPEEIEKKLNRHVARRQDRLGWHPKGQIDAESMQTALGTWAAGARAEDAIALIDHLGGDRGKSGFLVTSDGIWYGLRDVGDGFFPWREFRGTHLSPDALEITLTTGTRLHLTLDHFLPEAREGLDLFFRGLEPGEAE